jgi:hypothetical protein
VLPECSKGLCIIVFFLTCDTVKPETLQPGVPCARLFLCKERPVFKVSWGTIVDVFDTSLVIVPDANSLFNLYHVLRGYGEFDGCVPANIRVTNLDGIPIDMSKGQSAVAALGTRR